MKDNKNETHHFLPSGEWEGFYCYSNSPHQHKMSIELSFTNSIVSGSGIDDVAPFRWNGSYNLEQFKLKMVKPIQRILLIMPAILTKMVFGDFGTILKI
ncbi:hypothetical protein [Flavobacterium bizetiae]|uniref:hypothetical protein n=1 Tax=Flavobacterium bizetiae TaxID=2704140 RepID=UPI003757106B